MFFQTFGGGDVVSGSFRRVYVVFFSDSWGGVVVSSLRRG